jgi:PAS domain S-box-containing protein
MTFDAQSFSPSSSRLSSASADPWGLLAQVSDCVCCFMPEGRLTWVNGACGKYWRQSMDALLGQDFYQLLSEGDRSDVRMQLQALGITPTDAAEDPTADMSPPFFTPRTQVIRWVISAVYDASGGIVGLQAIRQNSACSDCTYAFGDADQYRQIVEHSPNPIFALDCDGHVKTYNLACGRLLQWTDAVLGQSFAAVLDESCQSAAEQVAAVLAGQSLSGVELTYRRPQGEPCHVIARMYPIYDLWGQVQGCVVANTDIGDRLQMERALRQSEARFRAIFAQNRVGMNWAGLDGQLLAVNPAFCQLVGYEEADLLARSYHDITHPEDALIEEPLHQQLIRGQIPFYSIEKRYLTQAGTYTWVNISVSAIWDEHQHPLFSVAIIENIQERKQMEAALRQSQDRYQMAIAAGSVGIWDWELDSSQMYVDPHLKALLGYADAEIPNTVQDWSQYVYPADRPIVAARLDSCLAGDLNTFEVEHRMMHRDGSLRWFLARGSVVYDSGDRPQRLVGTDTDITDRKLSELQIQHQAQREQSLNQVIQAIRNSLHLDTIFATATYEIGLLLPTTHVQIWQYSASQAQWTNRINHQQGPDRSEAAVRQFSSSHPLALQLQQRRILILDQPEVLLDPAHQDLAVAFPGAWLWLILDIESDDACDRTLWGALALVKDPTQGAWQPSDIDLARTIADQLAIAIQQSELVDRVQILNDTLDATVRQRTAQLNQSLMFEALLKRITDNVRDSLDESMILQTAVDELAAALQTISCDAAFYDLDSQTVRIVYESSLSSLPSLQGLNIAMADYADYYRQLLQGQAMYFCTRDLDRARECYLNYPTVTCIQPLIDDQGVLGDIWLYRDAHFPFNEMEIRLVEQVANQCAIAIRQSRLYQAIKRQVDELKQLNSVKDDFLSTVSHELRSPMASINMATQMLEIVLEQQQVSDRRIDQYLKILREQCNQELALINDLLDLQHLETGTQSIEFVPLSLSEWIPHIAESFELRVQNGEQHLHIEVLEQLPTVMSDPPSLTRILVELLNNACKYTPPEHHITVRAGVHGATWFLEVENTGIDIDPADQHQIFEKFYRVPRSDRWQKGGTGLGLALVKRLTECLGGSIHLSSHNQVTCFQLLFPVYPISSLASRESCF